MFDTLPSTRPFTRRSPMFYRPMGAAPLRVAQMLLTKEVRAILTLAVASVSIGTRLGDTRRRSPRLTLIFGSERVRLEQLARQTRVLLYTLMAYCSHPTCAGTTWTSTCILLSHMRSLPL